MPKGKMKEQAKQKLGELVERFRYNLDVYKKSTYNEAQVRREFIDPFFEALGWDVSNKQGFAEQYKEVVHEDAIKVGRSTRAPDYSFRIGGQRKFFVEAKKPTVNIKEDVSPAYQLRRYAWSAKLPLSVVTDCEEFSVFDCRIKPNPTDKSGVGRIAYYTFEDYLDKFDEIYDVFSKEAVLKGSFDRYAESTKGKKGTAEVDSEFFKEIESRRELLAKNVALRNPAVSIYELNYAVQKLLDRIIFLRICEDRGIEPYGQLQTKAESGDVYTHLLNHFKLAQSKYNSGIFDFDTDKITPTLRIDDGVLKMIVQRLYYPKSPYEFSVLGVEILGNVYEQFLGKVIRLTAGHQAKVETKPEVKKAGGVYYTPQYIVEYIVKNTVGKLIAGKTPDEIAELKILDPACGSGSFLIGAYTYLLKYHLDWYASNGPKKHKDAVFQVRENEWYLTTAEKKRILLNNIFGVDIDPQAVEVTKLSLLLKVLEHESRESIDQQVKLGLEGVLPNLDDNIKCGNSLIGPDFYDTQQTTLFNEEEMRRINVFDWNDDVKGFGEIMKRGGFDCVIGNPPYVMHADLPGVKFLYEKYSQSFGKPDLYRFFVEKSYYLLNNNGQFAFILPNTLLTIPAAKLLREFLLKNTNIVKICNFWGQVFRNAQTNNIILIYEKKKPEDTVQIVEDRILKPSAETLSKTENKCDYYSKKEWLKDNTFKFSIFIDPEKKIILKRIEDCSTPLHKMADYTLGMQVYHNSMHTPDEISNRIYHSKEKKDQSYFPESRGTNIKRYYFENTFKEYVAYGDWCYNKPEWKFFSEPRIVLREIPSQTLICAYTDTTHCSNKASIIVVPKTTMNIFYLLGILNSKLIGFYIRNAGEKSKQRLFPRISLTMVRNLPIKTIDYTISSEKAQHDKLVALVESMLELQKRYHEARMDRDKELYERQIKIVDAQIDRLVYDLYGLTEEEIEIVEKSL